MAMNLIGSTCIYFGLEESDFQTSSKSEPKKKQKRWKRLGRKGMNWFLNNIIPWDYIKMILRRRHHRKRFMIILTLILYMILSCQSTEEEVKYQFINTKIKFDRYQFQTLKMFRLIGELIGPVFLISLMVIVLRIADSAIGVICCLFSCISALILVR